MEVIDYPNYLIYPDGRVQNKKTKRYLKPRDRGPYKCVRLYNGIKNVNHSIHRLVAEHYVPNPYNKSQVDHINRDKTDNRVENLRWVTASENQFNQDLRKNCSSGYRNISYDTFQNRWKYYLQKNNVIIQRYFDNKIDAICYKFIMSLILKSSSTSNRSGVLCYCSYKTT
jgi:hypothetical protein